MKDQEKLESLSESLLEKGIIITQEELDHLQRQRNEEESDSVVTKILFFILSYSKNSHRIVSSETLNIFQC